MKKYYVVANWKMNNGLSELDAFASALSECKFKCEAWIAPQLPYLPLAITKLAKSAKIGAQNSSNHLSGAFTGETSVVALKEIGCHFVILGHSERRQFFAEENSFLNRKVLTALENGLKVIYCVGESLQEREAGKTFSVVKKQLQEGLKDVPENFAANLLIAYEPIWAIGTGKTASSAQAEEVHASIRNELPSLGLPTQTPILYGGSVKPDNFEELLNCPNVDGGLVGGASLKADSYLQLCEIANK